MLSWIDICSLKQTGTEILILIFQLILFSHYTAHTKIQEVFPRYQTQEVISNNVTATVIIQGIFLSCTADVGEGTHGPDLWGYHNNEGTIHTVVF